MLCLSHVILQARKKEYDKKNKTKKANNNKRNQLKEKK